MSSSSELKTVPFDPRFPNQNQTHNCFRNYVDYHRCIDLLEGAGRCEYFLNVYSRLCPNAWVEKWDQQREDGTFPAVVVRTPKLDDYIAAHKSEEDGAGPEAQ